MPLIPPRKNAKPWKSKIVGSERCDCSVQRLGEANLETQEQLSPPQSGGNEDALFQATGQSGDGMYV